MRRAIASFLEDRLGLISSWRAAMTHKRPPRGIGFLRTLGFCALTVCALQIMSGIALAMHYVPSVNLAYDSILALEAEVPWGQLTRSLHHFGASALVILAVLHLARVFFTGAYKAPRELTWVTGVGLLLIVLGFGFTGYLLPWDQKAYFATKVGTEIAGKAPLIGPTIREILNGGDEVGPPTLTRFYVIHIVLLPLGLIGLLGLHLLLIQRHGVCPPRCPVGQRGQPGLPYFPHHVLKEGVAGIAVTGILLALAATWPAPLEAMAVPSDTSYDPRPDWYFLGLFQLLKVFQGPLEALGAFWIPSLALVGLVLLPFFDRGPARHWRQRPLMTGTGVLGIAAIAGLTIAGARDTPENPLTLRHSLGLTPAERRGYLAVRRLRCTSCHALETESGFIGGSDELPDAPYLDEIDYEPDVLAELLAAPADFLGDGTDMPSFDHVPYEQRRAIGLYLQTFWR